MKSRIVPAALVAAAASFGPPSAAWAAITTEAGAICKPYGLAYAGSFFSNARELQNTASQMADVLCPIVRTQEVGPAGLQVYVDGKASSGATTTCWLYSYTYYGALLGIALASASGASSYDMRLDLPPSQVPPWSTQVVYCALPAQGELFDVTPTYY